MLQAFGDPQSLALKRQIRMAIENHKDPSDISTYEGRFARTTIRVALRQFVAANNHSPVFPAWLAAYDRVRETTDETGDPYEH